MKLWTSDIRIAPTGRAAIDEHISRVSSMLAPLLQQANLDISASNDLPANFIIKTFHYTGEDYVLGHLAQIACLDSGQCTHRTPSPPDSHFAPENYDWPFSDGDRASGDADYFHAPHVFVRDATVFWNPRGWDVGGYILTDGDHNIKKAVCYLDADLPTEAQKELVSECLVRGLGLLGIVTGGNGMTVLRQRTAADIVGEVPLPSDRDLAFLRLAYSEQVLRGDSRTNLIRKSEIDGCGQPQP